MWCLCSPESVTCPVDEGKNDVVEGLMHFSIFIRKLLG